MIKRNSERIDGHGAAHHRCLSCVQNGVLPSPCSVNLSYRHRHGLRCHHRANRKIIRWMVYWDGEHHFFYHARASASQLRSTNCNSISQTFLIKRDASWSRDGISLYGNEDFEIIFFVPSSSPATPRFCYARSLAFEFTRWHGNRKMLYIWCANCENVGKEKKQQAVLQSN